LATTLWFKYHRNHTNHWEKGLADFIVNDFIVAGLSTNLSGYYLDDEHYNYSIYPGGCSGSPVGGPTEEDKNCLVDMGHAGDIAWTTAITDSWCAVRHRAFDAIIAAGGWFWQMFSIQSTPAQATCATTLRGFCEAGASSVFYNATTMHELSGDHETLPNLAQDLATFLLLRGPYAWLGFHWLGCDKSVLFPDSFTLDYGTPTEYCSETKPGSNVFVRDWTNAVVQMDCNTYKGTITMKGSLDASE